VTISDGAHQGTTNECMGEIVHACTMRYDLAGRQILSRVTADLIQFDGMTTGGSSGSPVFNADGDVISVHRAGLRQGPGFALSVPVKYAIPLMPPALRQRLGSN